MTKLIKWMERIGAFFLFMISLLITVSVTLRYLFNAPLPDSDAISRLLLSIIVFWGLAGACYHDEQIRVDLLWERLSPRGRTLLTVFSSVFTLGCLCVLAAAALERVQSQMGTGERTYDIGVPIWPFYAMAWCGILAAIVALFARLRAQFGSDTE